MWKLITGIAVIVVASSSALAQLTQEPQVTSTRFGPVSVGKDKVLLFKGRPLQPKVQGNDSLDLGEPYRIGPTDVVLVIDNGGTACPFLYYFVALTKSGAKATPAFGTCAELTSVKRTGNTLSVYMPGYRGPLEPERERIRAARQRHVFVFRAGVVTENGKPVR